MPDENIRIVVEAIDLASARLRAIGKELDDAGRPAEKLDQQFRQLGQTQEALSRSAGNLGNDFRQLQRETERVAASHQGLNLNLRDSIAEYNRVKAAVESNVQTHRVLNTELQRSIGEYNNLRRSLEDTQRSFIRHRSEAKAVGDVYSDLTMTMDRLGNKMESIGGTMTKSSSRYRQLGKDLEDYKAAQADATGLTEQFGRSLLSIGPGFGAAAGGTYLFANALGSLSAGLIGVTSALSSLIGLADVVPAAFTGIAGSLAAVQTIFAPATSGILGAVKAQQTATDPTTAALPSSGGGSSAASSPKQAPDAERQLQRTRQQNVWQMADLEERLKELRIHNAQQVADAERNVARAELQGIQQITQAERALHDLKMQDRAQEQQLQQSLANAQASAAGEAARGGGEQGIANAAVQQAQDNLTQFQQDAASQEADAQDTVTQAVQQRNQQVSDAERSLARTRLDNANQLNDLETEIAHQRITNSQQVADAERSLAQARKADAQQAATAQAGANSQVQRYQQILQSLSPIQRQIVEGIIAIKNEWATLTAPARQHFLELALDVVHQLRDHLPALAQIVSHYADVITGIGHGLLNNLTQPQNFQRNSQFANQQASNLGVLGKAGTVGLQAIETFTTSKGSEDFLKWLAQATLDAAKFVNNLVRLQNSRDGFTGFFAATQKTLTQVVKIFWNLGDAFAHIFEVGFKPGSSFLSGIVNLTKRFDDWTKSQSGKDSLREFIHNGMEDLHRWAQILGPFLTLVGQLVVLSTNWTGPLKIIVESLQWVVNNPIGAAVVGPLLTFLSAMSAIGYILPGNQKTISRFFGVLKDGASFLGGTLIPALFNTAARMGLFGEAVQTAAANTARMEAVAAEAAIGEAEMGAAAGAATPELTAFGALIDAITLPMIAIVAAVVAVIAIFVILYFKWAPFHRIVDDIGNAIWDVLVKAFHGIVDAVKGAINIFEDIYSWVTTHWQLVIIALLGPIGVFVVEFVKHFDTVKDITLDVVNFILKHWQILLVLIGGPIGALVVFIVNHWDQIRDKVSNIVSDLMNFIENHWKGLIQVMFPLIGSIVIFLYNHWTTIKNDAQTLWQWMHDFPIKIWGQIVDYFQGNSLLAKAFQAIGGAVSKIWGNIWGGIESVAQDVWNTFVGGVNDVMSILGSKERLPKWTSSSKSTGAKSSNTPARGVPGAAKGGRFDAVPGGMIHIVEGGAPEYVISTDPKYRQRSLGLIMDALEEFGLKPPGYAGGGYVRNTQPTMAPINWAPGISEAGLQPALAYLAGWISSHGGIITSGTGGTHATNSYHYRGEAIDIGAPGYNSPWIWTQLYARARNFVELFGPTFMPGGGGLYHSGSRFSDPALQAEHQNHIHSAFTGSLSQIAEIMGSPGGGGGGVGGLLSSVISAVSPAAALHWVEDHIPGFSKLSSIGGKIGDIMLAVGDNIRDKFFDWIKKTPGLLEKVAEHLGGSLLSAGASLLGLGGSSSAFDSISKIHGVDPQSNVARARLLAGKQGWSGSEFGALYNLWNRESGWRVNATNASSGAYGIPQALPGSKMAAAGSDWRTNPTTQIMWGLGYIKSRYGDPAGAWAHEQSAGWYDFGGEVPGQSGVPQGAVVHGGEWILNRVQQMRLAQMFGGWQRAKQYLFTTQGPSYGSLFPNTMSARTVSHGGAGVQQTFILQEVQPITDMDFIMRKAELHMARHV